MATLDTVATRVGGTDFPAGKAYFETDTNKLIVWNGESWIELHSDGLGSAYQNRWGVTASNGDVFNIFEGTNPILLEKTGGYALSAWVNYTKTSGTSFIVRNSGSGVDYFSFHNDNKARINGLGGYQDVTMASGTTTGWHHHVMNYDGGTTLKYYVDGVYQGTNSKDLKNIPLTTVFTATTYHFGGGTVSDLALFNTSLSDGSATIGSAAGGDVASLRDNGKPVKITDLSLDLKAWWRMGDDPSDSPVDGVGAASITDSSGNGFNLSQTNASAQPIFYELPSDNVHRI